MIIIEIAAQPSGAHRNQETQSTFPVPAGWIAVPPALEAAARAALPFAVLTVENGVLTEITQGEVPEIPDTPEAESAEERLTALENAVERGLSL